MSDGSSDDELPLPPPYQGHPSKRSRGSYASNSSDPVYFSSDDLAEASVDNYVSPRKKKQYKRKWWEDESSASMRHDALKRASKRAKDSGVFMSSDSNSSTSEEGLSLEPIKAKLKQTPKNSIGALTRPPPPPAKKVMPHPDRLAQQRIQHCLDHDNETVDLSGCGLASLSNETLKPLRHLIRRPKSHFPHGDEAYESLAPSLKIFLSSNSLTSLPREVVNLEHLNVLSVRNNQLGELPQSLGKLHNLVELNVATNDLNYLPWELLILMHRPQPPNLHVRPNPLLSPVPPASKQNDVDTFLLEKWRCHLVKTILDREESTNDDKHHPIYIGSSLVTYRNLDGSLNRSSRSVLSQDVLKTGVLRIAESPTQARPLGHESSPAVPSLFELSLRSASAYMVFTERDAYLPNDTPESVIKGLDVAEQALEEGGLQCSVCQGSYIIPRAEWIEYWSADQGGKDSRHDELFLPFLRKACSWACADESFSART